VLKEVCLCGGFGRRVEIDIRTVGLLVREWSRERLSICFYLGRLCKVVSKGVQNVYGCSAVLSHRFTKTR